MSQSKRGNRYQISFKENVQEIELMNYMLEKSSIVGISSYIKTLIAEDMHKNKQENKTE